MDVAFRTQVTPAALPVSWDHTFGHIGEPVFTVLLQRPHNGILLYGRKYTKEVENSPEMTGGTVLIVEDVGTCATTLEMALLPIPNITVVVLTAARDALRILEAEDNPVRAVITDLNMPRMDGFELIERIRAEPRYRRLPIIVVSGDTDPQTPNRLSALGVDGFFPKPYSPVQVRLKLEQLLDANCADGSP